MHTRFANMLQQALRCCEGHLPRRLVLPTCRAYEHVQQAALRNRRPGHPSAQWRAWLPSVGLPPLAGKAWHALSRGHAYVHSCGTTTERMSARTPVACEAGLHASLHGPLEESSDSECALRACPARPARLLNASVAKFAICYHPGLDTPPPPPPAAGPAKHRDNTHRNQNMCGKSNNAYKPRLCGNLATAPGRNHQNTAAAPSCITIV